MKKFMQCWQCGNTTNFTTHEYQPKEWTAYCDECGCEGFGRTQDRAVEHWNGNNGMRSSKIAKKRTMAPPTLGGVDLSDLLTGRTSDAPVP